jgi:excinuclease UvrABC nuclease subunit
MYTKFLSSVAKRESENMPNTIELTDINGESHTFNVYTIGTNFKDIPGIYAFAAEKPKSFEIVYIGETESFKNRLSNNLEDHHQYFCAVIKHKATHFFTKRLIGGKQKRVKLETALRQIYSPICNNQ